MVRKIYPLEMSPPYNHVMRRVVCAWNLTARSVGDLHAYSAAILGEFKAARFMVLRLFCKHRSIS